MPPCPRCGHDNSPGTKYCRRCGTPLDAQPAPQPPPASSLPSPAGPSAPGAPRQGTRAGSSSLLDSLARLGLRPTCGQLVGFLAAVVLGLALARLLPLVFPLLFPLLSAVFIDTLHTTPDAFNSLAMTCLTCSSSFGLAFAVSLLSGRRRRRGP